MGGLLSSKEEVGEVKLATDSDLVTGHERIGQLIHSAVESFPRELAAIIASYAAPPPWLSWSLTGGPGHKGYGLIGPHRSTVVCKQAAAWCRVDALGTIARADGVSRS